MHQIFAKRYKRDKRKLAGGDIKAVQGDSGHSQVSMVTDVYSHIFEDERARNAKLIEEFYSGRKQTKAEPAGKPKAETTQEGTSDAETLMKPLQKPEIASLLKTLAQSL